jgi:hypothetical protein
MNAKLKSIKQKGLRGISLCLASLLLFNCTPDSKADTTTVTTNTGTTTTAKKIKIALLLDTSNSMDGLIDQARAQLWTMVNELAKAKCADETKPELEIALYEYGNDQLTPAEGYIRMVTPLTNDLDKISEDLFKLTTNGGSEFCGHVIQTSLKQLAWDSSTDNLQLVFIAGNEPFTQGSIDYRKACADAKSKNVIVNTIYCGNFDSGISELWKNGADLTGGSYMSIDQNRKTVYIESPYDDQISTLNNNLNDTYVYYGNKGVEQKQKQITQDVNSEKYGKQNTVNRAISKSSHVYKNSSWDLVDAKKEKKDITKVEKQYLPKELQSMTPEQLKAYVDQKEKQRAEISNQIQELNIKRETYIKEKAKAETVKELSLDDAMMKAVREQAKTKSMKFEK